MPIVVSDIAIAAGDKSFSVVYRPEVTGKYVVWKHPRKNTFSVASVHVP